MRRIGVLLPAAADDAAYQSCVAAFLQGLGQYGLGRTAATCRSNTRWADSQHRRYSQARGGIGGRSRRRSSWRTATDLLAALLQATRTGTDRVPRS